MLKILENRSLINFTKIFGMIDMSVSYIHTTTNRACPRCGSVNIVIDVANVWDVESQQWEMDGNPDEHGGSMTCADCSSDHWFLDTPKIIKWET